MKRFELKLKKAMFGKYYGNFQSFFKGEGLEVEDFRHYLPGDDIKNINWKLTAKHDKFFVNQFRQEKDALVNVYFDINYNWKGGQNQEIKELVFDYFTDLVLFGKSWGLNLRVYFPDKKGYIKQINVNKSNVKAIYALKCMEDNIKNQSRKYHSSLESFISKEKRISKRHVVIIFSDFLSFDSDLYKTLKVISKTNEIFLFRINIPNFEGMNFNSFVTNRTYKDYVKRLNFIDINI